MTKLDEGHAQRGTLGHYAYLAHCKHMPRIIRSMPTAWENLDPRIRKAWELIAGVVQLQVLKPLLADPASSAPVKKEVPKKV